MTVKKLELRVGSKLYVFIGLEQEMNVLVAKRDKLAIEALKKGEEIGWPEEGSAEWVTIDPVIDVTKEGSAQYTWEKSGDRVKCIRRRMKRWKDGKVEAVEKHVVYKNIFVS
jgi:hypothetical protein